jgi:hypothetical protein
MIGLESDVLPLNERRIEAVSDRRTSMTEASLEQSMMAARQEHVVPGREIHLQGMRGYGFCEVALITGTSQDNAIANIWNTTGACDPAPGLLDAPDGEVSSTPDNLAHVLPDSLHNTYLGSDVSRHSAS